MTTAVELQTTIDNVFQGFANGIKVIHENEEYAGTDNEWIRICVNEADGKRMSLGDNPLYRYHGICFVQVFVKPDSGVGRATQIADMVTPLLRDQVINGVHFFVPHIVKVGEVKGWYQLNVLTDYYRED